MKKIGIHLSILVLIIFLSSCFPIENGGDIDLQFVNNTPVKINNIKFSNEGKVFVDYKDPINVGSESDFKLVPSKNAEYIESASSRISYSVLGYNLAVNIEPALGPLKADKSYSIELSSSFCFKLWERSNEEVLFGIDSGKIKIGNQYCIDESDLPDLPF